VSTADFSSPKVQRRRLAVNIIPSGNFLYFGIDQKIEPK